MSQQSRPRSYKDLLIWKKAMGLAKLVYRLTVRFPGEEKFGLTSQIRRACVSVPSNIAEGQARQGTKEFPQFLSHAEGSLAELETQTILSIELGFVPKSSAEEILQNIDELQKMIVGLKRKLLSVSPFATRHSQFVLRQKELPQ
jgi:four helix bundle protein